MSKVKRPQNWKMIDGTVGSVRRLTVGLEQKHTKIIKGETGHGCLAFDKVRCGMSICKDEMI
jgi:hypothetical protein